MKRNRRMCVLWLIAVQLCIPGVCLAWGTLSEQLSMSAHESETLRKLISYYGTGNKAATADEIEPRRGPHVTHQFIVRQAYMLLELDPAYKAAHGSCQL